jgi:hypothetical protein
MTDAVRQRQQQSHKLTIVAKPTTGFNPHVESCSFQGQTLCQMDALLGVGVWILILIIYLPALTKARDVSTCGDTTKKLCSSGKGRDSAIGPSRAMTSLETGKTS